MRAFLIGYLGVVIALFTFSTGIKEEGVSLKHILIAGFGWPLLAPVLAWRAWFAR